jgi:phage terminase large subunit
MNRAALAIRAWKDNPERFVRECIGATPDEWQCDVLKAVGTHQRVALKASKGPGKSTVMAWLLWWFMATRAHPRVIATSISAANLKDGLWTEVSRWRSQSPFLTAAFDWTAERVTAVDHPSTWWASARAWSQSADSTQQSNTLAGVHADHMMFLIDEAGGIPDAVVATAEAGLANADPARGTEAKLIIAGNPTHLSGPLYRACTQERALWWVKEITGDPDDPQRAPRVSIAWAREQIAKYGRDNPWVLVNVFGKFPPGQADTLLGVEEVGLAATRVLTERDYQDEPKVLGVDVARFGDDETCIMLRQGRAAFRPKSFRNLDTMETAGQVALVIDKQMPDAVFIDVTGIGAGVVDRLSQLGYPVIGVDFGSRALSGKFANKRAEMWWTMADWVRAGGAIPDDATLRSELPGPKYKFTSDGRLLLESKDDMKKRGVPSPNRADALALTFGAPVARAGLRLGGFGRRPQAARDFDPYAAA